MTDPHYRTTDDMNQIHPGLFMGREPGTATADGFDMQLAAQVLEQFDLVVSCVPRPAFGSGPGFELLHAPLTDDAFQIIDGDWERASAAAERVVDAVEAGQQVLVYCREGMNRSGLVTALALRALTRCSGAEAVAAVQSKRPGSLYNWFFRSELEKLEAAA